MTQLGSDRIQSDRIQKEVLSELVKDRILQQILEGQLSPGERIVETHIARDLGISQAPVREALRALATLGLVESEPYRGTRVRRPGKEELVEAIEVRAILEGLAGRLAAARRSQRCLEVLTTQLEAMQEAAERHDAHELAMGSTRFHATIVRSAGNRTLERLWSMLEPFSRSYYTASVPGVDLAWLADRHRDILDAIRDRDPDRAAETLRAHAVGVEPLIDGVPDADAVVGG